MGRSAWCCQWRTSCFLLFIFLLKWKHFNVWIYSFLQMEYSVLVILVIIVIMGRCSSGFWVVFLTLFLFSMIRCFPLRCLVLRRSETLLLFFAVLRRGLLHFVGCTRFVILICLCHSCLLPGEFRLVYQSTNNPRQHL